MFSWVDNPSQRELEEVRALRAKMHRRARQQSLTQTLSKLAQVRVCAGDGPSFESAPLLDDKLAQRNQPPPAKHEARGPGRLLCAHRSWSRWVIWTLLPQ